jgi:hypothetical protein
VGLANTLMKLWTKLLAQAVRDFAEERQILSSSQAGFRPGHYTHIQTQLLALALEDAKLHSRDIYMAQVDFTNAFNRINHGKLFRIMADLGFPPDVIRLVRGVYLHCRTDFRTPYGMTDSLPIRRGTIQGDSLSPILFAIYIEPLLRWLHQGGRGYSLRGLSGALAVDSLAYADDLGTLSASLADHKLQVQKIHMFSRWADLTPNLRKSYHTAVLYGTLGNTPASPTSLQYLQDLLTGTIALGDGHLSYLSPLAPFEYLGIFFTMTLDWGPQRARMMKACREACKPLQSSMIGGSDKRLTLSRWVRRKLAYAFAVVPLSSQHLEDLDAPIRSVVKASYGLNKSMPTALLRDAQLNFGLEQEALSATYFTENARHLMWAMNHTGRLGAISRAYVDTQLRALWLVRDPPFAVLQHLSLARRYMLLTQSGTLRLNTPDGPYSPPSPPEHVRLFRDDIAVHTILRDRSVPLPMHLIRKLWELFDDPAYPS